MSYNAPRLYGFGKSTFTQTALLAFTWKDELVSLEQPFQGEAPRHPFDKVPVMVHQGTTIFETLAIAIYVEETFSGPPLIPDDPILKARTFCWISAYCDYYVKIILDGSVRERFVKPMFGLKTDEDAIKGKYQQMHLLVSRLEDQLLEGEYLIGADPTLADLFFIPTLFYFLMTPEGSSLITESSNVMKWSRRMAALPGVSSICNQAEILS